jgi:hypothetical protein
VRPGRLDLTRGTRDAALVLMPLVVGYALGLAEASVLVTVGALNLLLVEAPTPGITRWRVLVMSVVANSVAFGSGTLVALTPGVVQVPLVAVGVFLALWCAGTGDWRPTGFIAAVMFVFPVGLPAATLAGVELRPFAVLLGGIWVLAVLAVLSLVAPRGAAEIAHEGDAPVGSSVTRSAALQHSAVVGLTVALGLVIGMGLHLPRDYWIMLTVLVALQLDLASTLGYAVARILGTVTGAALAFLVATTTADPWILFPVLALSTLLCMAMRAVNYLVYATWITLTIILLLNLVYSGGTGLAVTRVLDTVIGGSLALLVALALSATTHRRTRSAAAAS